MVWPTTKTEDYLPRKGAKVIARDFFDRFESVKGFGMSLLWNDSGPISPGAWYSQREAVFRMPDSIKAGDVFRLYFGLRSNDPATTVRGRLEIHDLAEANTIVGTEATTNSTSRVVVYSDATIPDDTWAGQLVRIYCFVMSDGPGTAQTDTYDMAFNLVCRSGQ